MQLQSLLDNDLYKFSMMQSICQLYPDVKVRYRFKNRGEHKFTEEHVRAIRTHLEYRLVPLRLTAEEKEFLRINCPYLSPVFLDFLAGYQYDLNEVNIGLTEQGDLTVDIEGYWYRTVLWEVPLMAIISELYFMEQFRVGSTASKALSKIEDKARYLRKRSIEGTGLDAFADFGTRRRVNPFIQDKLVETFKEVPGFVGTSNVHFAMKHNVPPIGTHAHEWFMFHAAKYGYKMANSMSLGRWADVYKGRLGIALSDTFTSDDFFQHFDCLHAKLFDGVRHDSGDPIVFLNKVLRHYESLGIDSKSKTIVFSDGLSIAKAMDISEECRGLIKCSFGIGTHFTNDVPGIKPLNMVIKLSEVELQGRWAPAIKLSDNIGKNTGDPEEVNLCKTVLHITD